jgi:ubiquinone biosynthesis protein COQ4
MTLAADTAADFQPAPRPMSTKLDLGHALRALRRLLADKDDTVQVFEIMRALNGASTAKGYHRLLATPQGGRIAYERRSSPSASWTTPGWTASPRAPSPPPTAASSARPASPPTAWPKSAARARSEIDQPHPVRLVRPPHARRPRPLARAHRLRPRRPGRGLPGGLLLRPDPRPRLGADRRRRGGKAARRRAAYVGPSGRATSAAGRPKWLLGEDYMALMAEPIEAARARLGITRGDHLRFHSPEPAASRCRRRPEPRRSLLPLLPLEFAPARSASSCSPPSRPWPGRSGCGSRGRGFARGLRPGLARFVQIDRLGHMKPRRGCARYLLPVNTRRRS